MYWCRKRAHSLYPKAQSRSSYDYFKKDCNRYFGGNHMWSHCLADCCRWNICLQIIKTTLTLVVQLFTLVQHSCHGCTTVTVNSATVAGNHRKVAGYPMMKCTLLLDSHMWWHDEHTVPMNAHMTAHKCIRSRCNLKNNTQTCCQ